MGTKGQDGLCEHPTAAAPICRSICLTPICRITAPMPHPRSSYPATPPLSPSQVGVFDTGIQEKHPLAAPPFPSPPLPPPPLFSGGCV